MEEGKGGNSNGDGGHRHRREAGLESAPDGGPNGISTLGTSAGISSMTTTASSGDGAGPRDGQSAGGGRGNPLFEGGEGTRSYEYAQGVIVSIGYTDARSSGMAIPGANHALVIGTDAVTGEQFAVRAGPRLNAQGGCCVIKAQARIFDESFPDKPADIHTVQLVGSLNISLAEFARRATEFANITNSNSVPYIGVTSNSNSFAFTFIEGLGFGRPAPIVNAPGANSGSCSPRVSFC